jgi:hypothetical protein
MPVRGSGAGLAIAAGTESAARAPAEADSKRAMRRGIGRVVIDRQASQAPFHLTDPEKRARSLRDRGITGGGR